MLFWSRMLKDSDIWFLNLLMHSSLGNKDLLNFHGTFLLLFNSNEIVKIIGLWSLQNEAKTSILITVSWKWPETWFWWKVKHFDLGFLILHISRKSKVSFISISFVQDFFFKIGFLPCVKEQTEITSKYYILIYNIRNTVWDFRHFH